MAVIPGVTVLSRFEVVCVSVIGSNGALRNTIDSISFVCIVLTNAVPMDRGSVVLEIIGNMNCLEYLDQLFIGKSHANLEHRAPV